MSDWRYSNSRSWGDQGSGDEAEYANTVDEEELEDEQAYAETGYDQTYAQARDYPSQVIPQQGFWTDEPQTYHAQDPAAYGAQQQYYQTQQFYQIADDQGEATYSPTAHTGSMDVNFSVPPSEQGQSPTQQDRPSPPPFPDQGEPQGEEDDRTQDFVAQRQDSYERREEFHTAPDTALIRRVVDARRRIRESEAGRARAAARRERGRTAAAAAGGGGGGGGAGGGSRSWSGSGSGGKRSGSKASGSKSGGRG